MSTANKLLLLGGFLSLAVAVLHIIIVFIGTPAYRYFGAGEKIVHLAEKGSPLPVLITLFVAVVFSIFALYAFSGSGNIRSLPLLRIGLLAIGGIYTLRGLQVIPQIIRILQSSGITPPREVVFSLVSLTIGLLYLIGTIGTWYTLRK